MTEQDSLNLNRRSFVQLAAATGIGVAVSEKTYAGEPREPGPTAVLQSSSLKVTLNSSTGIPLDISSLEARVSFWGTMWHPHSGASVSKESSGARSHYQSKSELRINRTAMRHLLCMPL